MGYTRIEPLAGGAASLAALCNMTPICRTRGGEYVRTQRADSEGLSAYAPSQKEEAAD